MLAPARLDQVALVLLTVEMVVVCILTKVRLLAHNTSPFKGGSGGSRGGGSFVCEYFLGEDVGRQRWQGGYSAFEVVAVPISLHVCPLELAGPEGDLTSVACERVCRLYVGLRGDWGRHGGGLARVGVRGRK